MDHPRDIATALFEQEFGAPPTYLSWAPGRFEALGNHTDYNDGLVLSAAIQFGVAVAIAPRDTAAVRATASLDQRSVSFDLNSIGTHSDGTWLDYLRGVTVGLQAIYPDLKGFDLSVAGNVPPGAGLSSSAALEVAIARAIMNVYDIHMDPIDIAHLSRKAEHDFAGVNCGLLDQLSSLFGSKQALIHTDFRSLEISSIPLPTDTAFLIANSGVTHQLAESDYNERRESCEAAAQWFNTALDRPVTALRDVTWKDWVALNSQMPERLAKRSAHIIGENTRVTKARTALLAGDWRTLGILMFESHESSINYFENSCPELDFIVKTCSQLPGAIGARLTGGGFGGGALILTTRSEIDATTTELQAKWKTQYNTSLPVTAMHASDGAIR